MFYRASLLMLILGINFILSRENASDSTQTDSANKVISIAQIARPDFQQLIQKAISDSQFVIIYWDSSRNEVFIRQLPMNTAFWTEASSTDTLTQSNLRRNQSSDSYPERKPWSEIIEQIREERRNKLRVMPGEQEEKLLQELSGEEVYYFLSVEGIGRGIGLLEDLQTNQDLQIIRIEANQPVFIIKRGESER